MTKTEDPKPIGKSDRIRELQERIAAMELGEPATDMARTETPREAEARRRVEQRHREERWGSRVPIMYASAGMADLAARDDLRGTKVMTWLLNEASPTLILAGSVGTGKTHAAYAIANTAVSRGTWVEAWTSTDLLEALRPGGDPHVPSLVRSCDLLVLDDLGVSKPSDWAVEQLTALVDVRLREGRRQIVTTNHPYAVLEEAWGSRLMDRLRYHWTIVEVRGESRRVGW